MKKLVPVGLSVFLAACGGGNVGKVELKAVPESIAITGPVTGQCATGAAGTVYLYGGAAPYTVKSTFPQGLIVTPSRVGSDGGSVVVTVNGSCLENVLITIQDNEGKLTSVAVTNKKPT
jgi:hypothetical protein